MNVENENTSLMNSVTQLVQLIFLWRCWVKWSHGWWSFAIAFFMEEREREGKRRRTREWKGDFLSLLLEKRSRVFARLLHQPGFFHLISSQLTTLTSDFLCSEWQIHGRASVKGRCSFIFLKWSDKEGWNKPGLIERQITSIPCWEPFSLLHYETVLLLKKNNYKFYKYMCEIFFWLQLGNQG